MSVENLHRKMAQLLDCEEEEVDEVEEDENEERRAVQKAKAKKSSQGAALPTSPDGHRLATYTSPSEAA